MTFGYRVFSAASVAANIACLRGLLFLARAREATASVLLAGAGHSMGNLSLVLDKLLGRARRCRPDHRWNTWVGHDDFGPCRNACHHVSALAAVTLRTALAAVVTIAMCSPASARSPETDARSGIEAFAENCFSPFMTAEKAKVAFGLANLRYDFYDLDPFSDVAPSPVTGRSATPGTDRRCEVSFGLDFAAQAAHVAATALAREGIKTPADMPETYRETEGTVLLAARQLSPRRVAVVHVGTRMGPEGIETFLNVERLLPRGN